LTIPLAELFLSKAQIVELNRKDALDLVTLVLDHEAGPGDEETINVDLVAGLCAQDWGLYTTVSMAIEKLHQLLTSEEVELEEALSQLVKERLNAQIVCLEDAGQVGHARALVRGS
jgi:hypothetical protein